MPYVKFTEQQKEMARRTSIADLVKRQGGELRRAGKEYEWISSGGKVSINGNLWFDHYEQIGGDAIDFVRRYMNMEFSDAVEYLIRGCNRGSFEISPPVEKKEDEPFVLPERNYNMRRVYSYLLNYRGIDKSVLDTFVRSRMIYESAVHHNAVFVGFSRDGTPMHACFRSTAPSCGFRGTQPNSTPEFAFRWHGSSDTLHLFESPIDMLSFISMNKFGWAQHSYASGCGVSERIVYQMMQDSPHIKKVILCLDNDDRGRKSTKNIGERLKAKGIAYEVLVPNRKDWNEDLLHPDDGSQSEEQEAEECQESQSL